MNRPATVRLTLLLLLLVACSSASSSGNSSGAQPEAPTSRPTSGDPGQEELLERVAAIHGGAGPFAVAGYRMGEAALRELGLPRGSFQLLVVHRSPAEVQWSCVADGLQAASGTSLGKLNLRWEETAGPVESRIGTRDGQRVLRGKLQPQFLERYLNVPRERLLAAGREVAALPAEQVFTLEALTPTEAQAPAEAR